MEVCNPKEANNVLSQNQLIGYFLPCKMVVYQDIETNKVKIGMPKPTALIEMVHDASLQKFAADIEERLIVCIDKTK